MLAAGGRAGANKNQPASLFSPHPLLAKLT
jgi:hypothetical protein